MEQSTKLDIERTTFLSLCCTHDHDLLTERIEMTISDFERLTYLTLALGFVAYTQSIIRRYADFATLISNQFDRECDILPEYPDYFLDEQNYDKSEKWLDDFINTIPFDKQSEYREKLKTESSLFTW